MRQRHQPLEWTAERLSPMGGSKAGDFSFIRVESKAIMEKAVSERK